MHKRSWSGLKYLRFTALAVVLLFVGTTSVAQGLGTRFWDDTGAGTNCDVRDAKANNDKCTDNNYNVALVSTMSTSVPRGGTTVHIIYDNIPILTDASGNPVLDANGNPQPDGSKAIFQNKALHYEIQGASWCPTYTGANGVNNKDSANGGYFATSADLPDTSKISTGTEVTDFYVNRPDINGNEIPTRLITGTGVYRNSSQYCDVSGANYSVEADVLANDLQHQDGFPATTFYVELKVQPSDSLLKNGTNAAPGNGAFYNGDGTVKCDGNTPNQCQGISNKFRVLESGTPPGSVTYNVVSGSSIAASDDFNVTFTNSKYNFDSTITNDASRHYTAVYRFGADCSVVKNPGKWVHALLYDIDDSKTPGTDQQKALLVRTDSDGTIWTLPQNSYTNPAKTNVHVGAWDKRAASWTQDYNDKDSIVVDNQPSNKYYSLNFQSNPGDTYKLYIYDIRGDVVDQIGAPFDSVYYKNPCQAEVDPAVALSLSGGTYTADSSIANVKNLKVSAPWTRYFWYSTVDNAAWGAAGGQTQISPSPKSSASGNGLDVPGGVTYSSNDGTHFGGTWTVPATSIPAGAQYICTELALDVNSLTPSGATTSPVSGIAKKCLPIQGGAQPFFSVLGGDIAAGPGFGTACIPQANAGITANFNDTAVPYGGAASQLAALALDDISGFATGKYQSGLLGWQDSLSALPLVHNAASELSFANNPVASGTFGGKLGLSSWCVPDYFAGADPGTVTTAATSTVSLNSAFPSGTTTNRTYNGDVILTGGNLNPGTHATLRVSGNVYITGPVRFNSGASSAGNVPSFQLLVQGGHIWVDKSVGELDGFYDAQNGPFVTCANSSGAITGSTTDCTAPLVVKGSVATRQLILNRTSGDVNNLLGQAPAEVFQYSPQQWLGTGGNGSLGQWDSITSLPPIL